MNLTGFVLPAATIGLGALLVRPKRGFLPTDGDIIIPQAVIEESHVDDIEITQHPVEQGAAISDHVYKRPAELRIRCGWSNSPTPQGGLALAAVAGITPFARLPFAASQGALIASVGGAFLSGNAQSQVKAIYAGLLALQATFQPFTIYTGKRTYTNMLFKSLRTDTTKDTENALVIEAHCQQVIITNTQQVQVLINVEASSFPKSTTPTEDAGEQQVEAATTFVDPLQ
jgi:hypothetical protein